MRSPSTSSNSNITLDKDYIIDAGVGIAGDDVRQHGALTPQIYNDGIIGNIDGVRHQRRRRRPPTIEPGQCDQQRLRLQYGRPATWSNSASTPAAGLRRQQHLLGEPRPDARSQRLRHLLARTPTRSRCGTTCSPATGPATPTSPTPPTTWATVSTRPCWGRPPAAAESNLGNFVGNPAFVFPIDPRPGSDGPANFYIDAELPVDRSLRRRSTTPGKPQRSRPTSWATPRSRSTAASVLPGYGPRDIGAFEFDGTGGQRNRRQLPGRHHLAGTRSAEPRLPEARSIRSPLRRPTITVDILGKRESVEHLGDRPGPLRIGRQPVSLRCTPPA